MLIQRRTLVYVACALGSVVAQGPYPDGTFIFPPNLQNDKDTARLPKWTIGSVINIQWNASYERSNLFYSQWFDDGTAQLLVGNTDKKELAWTVKPSPVYTNLSIPFHLRVVNTRGSQADQAGGGIWSSGFFFAPEENSNSASISSTASLSISSTPSSSPTLSTGSSTLPYSPSGPASTSEKPTAAPTGKSGLSGGAIAGTVIGSAFALFAFVGFVTWARRRRNSRKADANTKKSHELNPGYPAPHEYSKYQQQAINFVEAPDARDPAEIYGDPKPPRPPAELGG